MLLAERQFPVALKGVPKSENHKQKLRTPKPKIICRIYDKKEKYQNVENSDKIQTTPRCN
jgi:hypothetical protein